MKNFIKEIIVIIVILSLGTTSVFAEKSVPGNLLYGVKIFVNEPVAGVFAFTKEEKTEWKERLVERRLEEAKKLISENKLDEASRLELENKIKNQVEDFNVKVKELALVKNQSVNSSDLNIRMQASLQAYKNVFDNVSSNENTNETTKQETKKLVDVIQNSSQTVNQDTKIQVSTNQPIEDSSTASQKQKDAENLLKTVKLSYQKDKIKLSVNIQTQIDNKLSSSEKSIEEGKILLNTSDYKGAVDKFNLAINTLNSTKLLMLSNVIKSDIESDDNEDDSGDIEENDYGTQKSASYHNETEEDDD